MLGHQETGNETYVLELVRALAQRESTDTFFVYVENPDALPSEVRKAPHMRVQQLKTRSGATRLLREFPQRAAQDRLDVLHFSYNAPLSLPAKCAAVVTIHDISFEEHPEWFPRRLRAFLKWSVPRSARMAAAVTTDTECAKADIVRLYRLAPSHVQVTPYAAHSRYRPIRDDAALAATRAKYNTTDHFVLAVCNMQPRKNLVRLMQAFALAKQKSGFPHKLVLVGQQLWMTNEVLAQAREWGDAVVMTGYVPDADLPLLYNAADVFAYPSLYEGFGLPVLEAMACGAAVITSNVSSLPEVSGDAARLVDPYDVDDMAAALMEIVRNEPLKLAWRAKGLERAKLFTWERTAEQTVQIYHLAARALRAPPAGFARVPLGLRE